MIQGAELADSLRKGRSGGLPWTVILDAEGAELVCGVGPEGNVGCPVQPEEVAHFLSMIDTTRSHMSDAQFARFEQALHEFAGEILAGRKR